VEAFPQVEIALVVMDEPHRVDAIPDWKVSTDSNLVFVEAMTAILAKVPCSSPDISRRLLIKLQSISFD
jgi:hypothetical protein